MSGCRESQGMLFVGKLARRRGRRGEKHTQEMEGEPREYNMFGSFQKSLCPDLKRCALVTREEEE